ncbi:hypothetical protein V6Z12_D07G123500 [Gossypium hirsutum]
MTNQASIPIFIFLLVEPPYLCFCTITNCGSYILCSLQLCLFY